MDEMRISWQNGTVNGIIFYQEMEISLLFPSPSVSIIFIALLDCLSSVASCLLFDNLAKIPALFFHKG